MGAVALQFAETWCARAEFTTFDHTENIMGRFGRIFGTVFRWGGRAGVNAAMGGAGTVATVGTAASRVVRTASVHEELPGVHTVRITNFDRDFYTWIVWVPFAILMYIAMPDRWPSWEIGYGTITICAALLFVLMRLVMKEELGGWQLIALIAIGYGLFCTHQLDWWGNETLTKASKSFVDFLLSFDLPAASDTLLWICVACLFSWWLIFGLVDSWIKGRYLFVVMADGTIQARPRGAVRRRKKRGSQETYWGHQVEVRKLNAIAGLFGFFQVTLIHVGPHGEQTDGHSFTNCWLLPFATGRQRALVALNALARPNSVDVRRPVPHTVVPGRDGVEAARVPSSPTASNGEPPAAPPGATGS